MNADILYHLALVLHITGLTMMAGTTITNYVLFNQFWKAYALEKQKAIGIVTATKKLAALFGVGFLLLIISGVTMMTITHGVFGEQVWFRIKFALILLIIINGIVLGRRQNAKLGKILAEDVTSANAGSSLLKIRSNLTLFHISQIVLFLIIYTLSVFKFN